jgi:protein TonB
LVIKIIDNRLQATFFAHNLLAIIVSTRAIGVRNLLLQTRNYRKPDIGHEHKITEDPMNLIKLKKPEADLYRLHKLYLQFGTITTLLLFIALFRINFTIDRNVDFTPTEVEVVEVEEIITTVQDQRPPPPPRPSAPVEVPNDEFVVDDILDLDAELRFDDPIFMNPPAPPTAVKEEDEVEPEIFIVVERMPELIGGLQGLQSRIVYPEIARLAGIEGRVMVQFVIDEQGNVLNPIVIRGIGGGCDEAAVDAVKKAKFIPGMQRGRPVKVRYTLPVTFRLNVSDGRVNS